MNKIVQNVGMAIVALTAFIGCSKKDLPLPPACTNCTTPPTVTASITTSNPAWYNDSATVTYTTTGGDSITLNQIPISGLSGTITFYNLKKDSSIILTVKGPGGTESKAITLNVYSERRTLLCNYGPVHMISYKGCNVDSVNSPTAWNDGPEDCNTYQFFANDSTQMITGFCYPSPGSVFKSFWSFQNNESDILFSDIDLWHLDSLDVHGFQRSQIKADLFNPAVFYIAVQKFSH